MKNGFFVIDSHCHIYPQKIAEKAIENTDNFYSTHSVGSGIVENLAKHHNSVDLFLVQSVATTAKQVKSINEFIASSIKGNSKFVGLGTMYPDSLTIEEDFEHLKSLGLKGIKMHPDIQKFAVDDDRMKKIYSLASKSNIPVLLHTGDNRYDYSNPNRLIPVLKEFPNLTFIGAHFGGYTLWEEAAKQLKDIPNLYVDCSSSFAVIGKDRGKKLIEMYTPDKVLFGSDYPMYYPENDLETIFSMGFSSSELKKILSENAKKVYGLNI